MEFVFCSLVIALIFALTVASIMMLIFGVQSLINRELFGIASIIFSIVVLMVAISLAMLILINFF